MNYKTNEDYEAARIKKAKSLKGVLHIFIGAMIILLGLFLMVRSNFNLKMNLVYKPDVYDKIIGLLFMLYGVFRIYRGVKKY